jgi:hypothetical protein
VSAIGTSLESILGAVIIALVALFLLNRLAVLAYMVGCVVHTARARDSSKKDAPRVGDDALKKLNVWMVRTWWAIVAAVAAYCVVRALR